MCVGPFKYTRFQLTKQTFPVCPPALHCVYFNLHSIHIRTHTGRCYDVQIDSNTLYAENVWFLGLAATLHKCISTKFVFKY